MKINKKESIIVEGFDWSVEILLPTEDYPNVNDLLIEAATCAIEGKYHSDPDEFKIGAVVKVMFKKSNEYVKYINAYQLMCNASLFNIRKNYLKASNVDLIKEPIIG